MVKCHYVVLVVACVVGVLSLAAVITLIVIWSTVLTPFQDYAVVIDAGSTHSKIFVYTWPADKSDGLGTTSRVSQLTACDVPGGAISSVNPATADGVKSYFDSAMTACVNEIPSTRKGRALIFLGATAGLRVINISNPTFITNLLSSTRSYFATLGLLFRQPEFQARIISGSEEGISGWISTNILMRQLYDNNKPSDTYGVLDMGGASTQISFINMNDEPNTYSMNLFDTIYKVYSYSYLCYGQEETRNIYLGRLAQADGSLVISDPCLQSGFNQSRTYDSLYSTSCRINRYELPNTLNSTLNFTIIGTGNYTQCRSLIRRHFNTSCVPSMNCSFNDVYQPNPIPTTNKFLAISAVYSTFSTLALQIPLNPDSNNNYNLASTNLTQINKTIEKVCSESWLNVNTTDTRYRPLLCFYSTYHWTLFEEGYHMTSNNFKNFQIVKNIDSNEIGWTLGYMINQTNYLDPESRPTRLIPRDQFIGILIAFLVLLIASIIAIIVIIIILLRRKKLPPE